MGKKNFNIFDFVYKIIRFIFLIPINIIKYFCVGFYYVIYIFINIILYAVIFVSFGVYKFLKYLVLFFSFPIILYNILHKNKNHKIDKAIELESQNYTSDSVAEDKQELFVDNKVDVDSESFIEPIINIDEMLEREDQTIEQNDIMYENFVNLDDVAAIDDSIPNEDVAEPIDIDSNVDEFKNNIEVEQINTISESIIDSPIKVKTPKTNYLAIGLKKLFRYFYVGMQVLCFPVYKVVKYFTYGIGAILLGVGKTFTYLSFGVYKLLKYLLLSLTLPIMLINAVKRHNDSNSQLKEELKLKRQEAKFKKQLLNQKKQEEKLRLAMEKKQQREKQNEEYINENVKIEKKSFSQKFNDFLNKFFSLPGVLVSKIKNAYNNSVFVKNSRNKRDMSRQALLIDFEGADAEKSDVKLVYQYTAKNADGKIVTDYFEAFSKVEVHSFLLSEGYEVYSIKTNKWIQFAHKDSSTSKTKIKNKDLIFFLNQLSTYIKAGIPLVESLKILARQYNKQKKYQKLFRTLIYDLSMGDSFSTALGKQGEAFPRILINMVKASEMTGELPEVLDDMADYFTEMDKTKKQMVTALMYPIIILVVSIVVIVFILLFVIPKFVSIYESMDAAKIPKFTLIILGVSDFLKNNFVYLLIGVILGIIVIWYLYKNVKVFRTLAQWVLMHMPVFGNVIIYNEVTTFTKTFSSLLAHNVFITDSMEILNKITDNEIYKMLILDTITNLAKGEKISESFKDHWAFPIPAYEMLVTGERTGQLPEMMAKVSSYYQELHRNSVTRIKTFIEPFLILFLTVIVGVIVLAIVIPMFGLYESVQSFG